MANNAAVSTFVSDLTQDRFIPSVIDNIYSGNVLLQELQRAGRIRTYRGGATEIAQPVYLMAGAPTTGGSYAGFDAFTTTQESKTQKAIFRISQYYWNVSLAGNQLGRAHV